MSQRSDSMGANRIGREYFDNLAVPVYVEMSMKGDVQAAALALDQRDFLFLHSFREYPYVATQPGVTG